MNEELAAYITRLCELSGHTTRIKKDLIRLFIIGGVVGV